MRNSWTAAPLLLIMASTVRAQETRQENVVESLRQMREL